MCGVRKQLTDVVSILFLILNSLVITLITRFVLIAYHDTEHEKPNKTHAPATRLRRTALYNILGLVGTKFMP